MKKIFTLLSMVMLCALAINADNYRRTWDFRGGYSASTLEIMAQDPTHWTVQSTGFQNTGSFSSLNAVMTYDGEDIPVPELEGLTLGAMKSSAHVQIYDGKSKNSSFPDLPCLWINGKNSADYVSFTVPAGENVKIGYCSHSNSQARGFKTSGGFADVNGNTTFTSMADGTVVEVELINSNTEEAVCKLASTSGHHIYYIIIGDGDAPLEYKVGYLYYDAAGNGFETLPAYAAIKDMEAYIYEPINLATTAVPTQEELGAYDAVVIDGSLQDNADVLSAIKPYIYFQPVVNFCSSVAQAFGFGEVLETETEIAWAVDAKKNWFTGFENWAMDGMYAISNGEVMPKPLKLSAHTNVTKYVVWGDEEYAYGDSVIAYAYNDGHNAYIYYGLEGDYAEGTDVILQNVIASAAASKTDVTACPKPSISGDYSEMKTVVSISDLNKNAVIHYTVDGTEPTLDSPVYTEPLEFTTETTVKALAIANGYTISDVNTFEVKLYHQAKAPAIYKSGDSQTEDAVITLSSSEDVNIWYNFTGSEDTLQSSKYVEPIVLKVPATITAFAVAANEESALVQSEPSTAEIYANISNVRRDELAHFSASGWNTLDNLVLDGAKQEKWAASNYYFSWGKTATASYINSEDPIVDADGNPVMDENGNFVYEKTDRPTSVTTNTADPDWQLTSRGQVMIYQSNTLGSNIGNFGGYNPTRAEDYLEQLGTTADVQFAGVASGDIRTAAIATTKTYAGPFNVVAIVANISGNSTTGVGNSSKVVFQISADGVNWEDLGDTLSLGNIYRNYKKLEVSYNEEAPVYVRLASAGSSQGVHDIYIFNRGEKSIELEGQYTGIDEATAADDAVAPIFCKYMKNGRLVISNGTKEFSVNGARLK